MLKRLPEDISLGEIACKIKFIAAVKEGFEEIEHLKGIPIEKVEQMIDSWISK